MLRTTALTLACLGLTAPSALADAAAIDRALALVPEDAISFVAVPNLKALSDDIAQLVEATGQGGLLSMGRPIDVLKAQLGVGANLDEKGAAAAYFPPVPAGAAPVDPALPIVVVPTTDGEAPCTHACSTVAWCSRRRRTRFPLRCRRAESPSASADG